MFIDNIDGRVDIGHFCAFLKCTRNCDFFIMYELVRIFITIFAFGFADIFL